MGWTTALVIFFVAAVLVRARSDSFWLFGVALVFILAHLIVRQCLRRLVVVHDLDRDHVFPGERVTFTLRLINRSPLPAPWVFIEERVPTRILREPAFSHVATLPPGATREHRYEVQATERGVYRVGHLEVAVGDWFGLREQGGTVDEPRWLTVFPRVIGVAAPRLPSRLPLGPRRDPASPFRDLQPIGLRNYEPGDPLRLIAWKASARRGELLVKNQPLVRERVTCYFLDLSRGDWDPSGRYERMERAVTVAASLVWWDADPHHAIGLVAWGRSIRFLPEGLGRESDEPGVRRLTPRPGAAQRRAIMEALAGLQPADGAPFVETIQAEAPRLPWGATAVILAPTNTDVLMSAAGLLRRRGHPVVVLCFEPRRTMQSSVPVYEVDTGGPEVRFA